MEQLRPSREGVARKPLPLSSQVLSTSTIPATLHSTLDRDSNSEQRRPLMRDAAQVSIPSDESLGKSKLHAVQISEKTTVSTRSTLFRALKDWKTEVACCFLGLASLAAIAGTLAGFQGQPLPQLPYQVSLNSLISLYVILLRVAILVILCSGEPGNIPGWLGHL